MRQLRLMIQKLIKAEGLKSAQIEWESIKPQSEQIVKWLKENNELEAAKIVENNIQTIERDLYPNRGKSKGSGWIWILAIGGIIIMGLVGFVWYKKRKK